MNIFITGTAGFIGMHTARQLLDAGHTVHGFDGLTDYYDVGLKQARHAVLAEYPAFEASVAMLEDNDALQTAVDRASPDVIIHLAAQAGVRYSYDNPRAYLDANVIGTFNVMEAARRHAVKHLLMASTSSVYGANTAMPYAEMHKADTQMSFYAATKKANEAMGHVYAHLHGLPTTLFRFFTVYGPWSRPDMAPIKFTRRILAGEPIDVYNHGEMWRDFTYVEDLARGIQLLVDCVPPAASDTGHPCRANALAGDSLSSVAPYRIVNIGNSEKVYLPDFIAALEKALGRQAQRHDMAMQPGDVPATWADARLLAQLTGYQPETRLDAGMQQFVAWYKDYYGA